MDRERVLSKFDQIDNYLEELEKIKPAEFDIYKRTVKDKLACERLLQLSIESVLDVCNILVSKFRTGIPSDEEDVFNKLEGKKIISKNMKKILIGMKSVRNILVHRYGTVDDEKIFEILSDKMGDFDKFKEEVLRFLKSHK